MYIYFFVLSIRIKGLLVTGLTIELFSKWSDGMIFSKVLHVLCDGDTVIFLLQRDVSIAGDNSGQREVASCVVTWRDCKDRPEFPRYIYNSARLLFGVVFSFPYIQAFNCKWKKTTLNIHDDNFLSLLKQLVNTSYLVIHVTPNNRNKKKKS